MVNFLDKNFRFHHTLTTLDKSKWVSLFIRNMFIELSFCNLNQLNFIRFGVITSIIMILILLCFFWDFGLDTRLRFGVVAVLAAAAVLTKLNWSIQTRSNSLKLMKMSADKVSSDFSMALIVPAKSVEHFVTKSWNFVSISLTSDCIFFTLATIKHSNLSSSVHEFWAIAA